MPIPPDRKALLAGCVVRANDLAGMLRRLNVAELDGLDSGARELVARLVEDLGLLQRRISGLIREREHWTD